VDDLHLAPSVFVRRLQHAPAHTNEMRGILETIMFLRNALRPLFPISFDMNYNINYNYTFDYSCDYKINYNFTYTVKTLSSTRFSYIVKHVSVTFSNTLSTTILYNIVKHVSITNHDKWFGGEGNLTVPIASTGMATNDIKFDLLGSHWRSLYIIYIYIYALLAQNPLSTEFFFLQERILLLRDSRTFSSLHVHLDDAPHVGG
jgi:hypothetical protein